MILDLSPLRKVVKTKLTTDSLINIKYKSMIISEISGSFFSTISNKFIFGIGSDFNFLNKSSKNMHYNNSQFSILNSKILIIFFLFSLVFFSCKRADNSLRTQKIDNLLIELDTIDSKLDSIGLININEYCNTIENNCKRIENHQNSSQNKIFIKYCNLFGNLQSFKKRNKFFRNSVKKRIEQLEKLLYDLKFNPVTDKEFSEYLSIETNELSRLKAKIQHNHSFGKTKIQLYDSLNSIIEKSFNSSKWE